MKFIYHSIELHGSFSVDIYFSSIVEFIWAERNIFLRHVRYFILSVFAFLLSVFRFDFKYHLMAPRSLRLKYSGLPQMRFAQSLSLVDFFACRFSSDASIISLLGLLRHPDQRIT